MRRHLLGLFAFSFLAFAAVVLLAWPADSQLHMSALVSLRCGITLGALWMGLPGLEKLLARVPPWLAVVTLVLILVIAARPLTAIYLLPLLAAMWILTPRRQSADRRR